MTELSADRVAPTEATEQLVEAMLAAYHAHDPQALSSFYAEDAVVRVGEVEIRGRAALAAFWGMWFAAFPDVSSAMERVVIEPGRFVLEWTEHGTHQGPVRMGDLVLPPLGRPLAWRGVSIYEVDGGEVVSVDYHVDRLQLVAQLVRPVALALAAYAAVCRAAEGWRSRGAGATRRR